MVHFELPLPYFSVGRVPLNVNQHVPLNNFGFSKNPTEVAESLQETKAVTSNYRDYTVLIYIFMKVIIAV